MTSGGWQSIPDLAFPGGALIGCAAGFMNAPRLKAIHNAIRSGIAAADAVAAALAAGRANDRLDDLRGRVLATGIGRELRPRPQRQAALGAASAPCWASLLGGIDMWVNALFRFSPFGTLRHAKRRLRRRCGPIAESRREDLSAARRQAPPSTAPSSVFLANLAHDEDQPVHLRLADPAVPIRDNLPVYGEPAPLYCPAGVYEVVEEGGAPVFRINAGNCVHCKTCDIKDPAQNITWVPPEGGSGPNYAGCDASATHAARPCGAVAK